MSTRALITLGLSLFATSLLTGIAGLLGDHSPTMRVSVLVSLASVPALTVGALRREHATTESDLAAAHRAGYALALDHVARGLLDQPKMPTDGDRADHRATPTRRLYVLRHHDERATG